MASQFPMPFVDAQQVLPGLPRTNAPPALPITPGSLYGAGLGPGIGEAGNQSPLSGKPTNEDEKTRNVDGWDKFLQSLDNPAVQDMIMTFGGMLTQPRAPGQSFAGHIGASALGGLQAGRQRQDIMEKQGQVAERTQIARDTLEAQKEAQAGAAARGERQLDIQESEAKANEAYRKAQVEAAKATAVREQAKMAQDAEKIRLEFMKFNQEGRVTEDTMLESGTKIYESAVESALAAGKEPPNWNEFYTDFKDGILASMSDTKARDTIAQANGFDGYASAPPGMKARIDFDVKGARKRSAESQQRREMEASQVSAAAGEELAGLRQQRGLQPAPPGPYGQILEKGAAEYQKGLKELGQGANSILRKYFWNVPGQ